jgi:hypothetical protein
MSPRFVRPYVKSNKNDARDAEAICEAVGRPSMRFVVVKSVAGPPDAHNGHGPRSCQVFYLGLRSKVAVAALAARTAAPKRPRALRVVLRRSTSLNPAAPNRRGPCG